MPAAKKRLSKIIDAVASIVGDDHSAKKLRKKKALKRFIEKLEHTKRRKEKEIASGDPNKKETKKLSEQVDELTKQIHKAEKVLDDLS